MTKNRKENRSRRIFGCLIIDTEFFKKYSSALRCPFFQITLELSAAVLVLLPLVSYGPSKKVLHMLPGRRKEPCCHSAVGASVKNGGCPAPHNNRCLMLRMSSSSRSPVGYLELVLYTLLHQKVVLLSNCETL